MRIALSKHSKPRFLRLRLVQKPRKLNGPPWLIRFLAPPTFDFKFLGDHLKNYFTMSALCILAVWLARKGGNYDRSAPFLGMTLAILIAVAAFVFGGLNVVQLLLSVGNPRKGRWRWKLRLSVALVFLSFFFTAVYQHGMDAMSPTESHGTGPNR